MDRQTVNGSSSRSGPQRIVYSRDKREPVATARLVALALACEFTWHSASEIGRSFRRAHTLPRYAARTIKDREQTDAKLARTLAALRAELGAM